MIDFTVLKCLSHILLNSESLHKRSWWRHVMVYVFLLTWTVRGVQGNDCGGQMNDSFGVIMTEGYPSRTSSLKKTCTWTIEVDLNKTITLKFKDFDLAPPANGSCSESYVSVARGNDGASIGSFCGSDIPLMTDVTGEAMVVTFYTSGIYTDYRGFYAEYTKSGVKVMTGIIYSVQPPKTSVSFQVTCGGEYLLPKISTSLYRADVPGKKSNFTLVAESLINVDNGTVKIFVDDDRVSVSGNSHTFLAVTFHNATCKDSGIYRCVYGWEERNIEYEEEIIRIIYVSPALTLVENTLAPDDVPCRKVGSEVRLTCTLLTGPLYPGIKRDVIFENSQDGDTMLWEKISGQLTQNESKVPSDECQLKYESILIKKVTESDYGSPFRCAMEESGAFRGVYLTEKHPLSTFQIQPSVSLKKPYSVNLTYQIKEAENKWNNKLILTCWSITGAPRSGPTLWHWEYRTYGSNERWKEYKINDYEANVTMDDNCQVCQVSTMVMTVTPDDDGQEIRCYFSWNFTNGSTESFEHLAAFYPVTFVTIGTKEEYHPKENNDTLVLASLIAGCVSLTLLGLLVWYFCSYRRTSQVPAGMKLRTISEPFRPVPEPLPKKKSSVRPPKVEERRYSSSVDFPSERRVSTSV